MQTYFSESGLNTAKNGGNAPIGSVIQASSYLDDELVTEFDERYLKQGNIEVDTSKFDTDIFKMRISDAKSTAVTGGILIHSNNDVVGNVIALVGSNSAQLIVSYHHPISLERLDGVGHNLANGFSDWTIFSDTHNKVTMVSTDSYPNRCVAFSYVNGILGSIEFLPPERIYSIFYSEVLNSFVGVSATKKFYTISNTGVFTQIAAPTIADLQAQVIYVGKDSTGVEERWYSFVSNILTVANPNNPRVWTPITHPATVVSDIRVNGKNIVIQDSTNRFHHYSFNGGVTWLSKSYLPYVAVLSVCPTYISNGVAVSGVVSGNSDSFAYITKDFGDTWERVAGTFYTNTTRKAFNYSPEFVQITSIKPTNPQTLNTMVVGQYAGIRELPSSEVSYFCKIS